MLLRELSDDEDGADLDTDPAVPEDPSRPWVRDFRAYLDALEHVPEEWSTIEWWGVSCSRFIECTMNTDITE
jgi:hypothetical protein